MKYVEPIKSIILTFLVLLSISLTLMIWNYEPDYDFLEDPDVEQIVIGEEKPFRDIVRPYKALFTDNDTLHGTVSVAALDQSMDLLASLDIGNIRVAQDNATSQNINKLLNEDEQIILFFNTTVPLETLNLVLNFNQNNVENVQFDRIIMNKKNLANTQTIELRFINTKSSVIYRAVATVTNENAVRNSIQNLVKNSVEYSEFERSNELSLYLPKNNTDVKQFTYFIDETSQELLTGALFTESPILEKTVEGDYEKYHDGMSRMTLDTTVKTMNYFNGSAENPHVEPAAKLLNETYNFVNDHGGFNADFRLSAIDTSQKQVEYQLFFQGHPVYSSTTLTRISTVLGDNKLFRYRRPYYKLETDISTEKTIKELSKGEQVVEYLNAQVASPNSVDDLVIGFLLVKDQNTGLFVLMPNWFAVSENSWTQIIPPHEGSVNIGLE